MTVLLEYIDLLQFAKQECTAWHKDSSHYASIMLNSFNMLKIMLA